MRTDLHWMQSMLSLPIKKNIRNAAKRFFAYFLPALKIVWVDGCLITAFFIFDPQNHRLFELQFHLPTLWNQTERYPASIYCRWDKIDQWCFSNSPGMWVVRGCPDNSTFQWVPAYILQTWKDLWCFMHGPEIIEDGMIGHREKHLCWRRRRAVSVLTASDRHHTHERSLVFTVSAPAQGISESGWTIEDDRVPEIAHPLQNVPEIAHLQSGRHGNLNS